MTIEWLLSCQHCHGLLPVHVHACFIREMWFVDCSCMLFISLIPRPTPHVNEKSKETLVNLLCGKCHG